MKNNSELQTDVQNALKWEPSLNAARIAWKTPGIWSVVNDLAVDYYYELVG